MTTDVRASSNLEQGTIDVIVEIAAPPLRVFTALASDEILTWWVNPGVFDTREWVGDVRVGGRWRAAGMSRGKPYVLEGEFLEVDPPRRLVHTWHLSGVADTPTTTVSYSLEEIDGGTRLTLRHWGFSSADWCWANRVGWETSLRRLLELFARPNQKENFP
jgi:uncharacterized protein YndB with AHSA1/START domain